jgi:pre-rRNA-processing protein TSR4
MACQKDSYVLLGFEDEFINEKHKSAIDFTTNKIGGKPVRIFSNIM